MATIEWQRKFEVGHYKIDSEHKIFVSIVNKIFSSHKKGNKQLVELTFIELLKYAEFHFCSEEVVMFENKYPDLLHHKKDHENLLAELRNRLFSLKLNNIDIDKLEIFILDWFKNHTSINDQKLVSFLNKK